MSKTIVETHFEGKSIKELKDLAQLAEAAERYEDMTQFMKAFVKAVLDSNKDIDTEGRNLLSVAYKNVVGTLRTSWRTLTSEDLMKDEQSPSAEDIKKYKTIVEKQLETVCQDVLDLLEKELIPKAEKSTADDKVETQVFYKKMVGDYYRYLCEFAEPESDKLKTQKTKCEEWYTSAQKDAEGLPETHPTRLGIALNFSVCQYEILKNKAKACKIAKEAFDEAVEKLDRLNDNSYKDSTMIMQLLRDNLTLWTSDEADNQDQD